VSATATSASLGAQSSGVHEGGGNRTAPAYVAGYFRRVPLTACLSVAPAENFGALDALILTGAPVCGLRPVRAPRLATENFPKPVIATSSPFLSVLCTVLIKD
jgi:hypothetical protein